MFDEGEAPITKSLAATFTTRVTLALWLRLPLVPVMVKGYVPAGVEQLVETVSVEDPELLIEAGLKLGVAPLGKPLTPRLTVPVNPLSGLTLAM